MYITGACDCLEYRKECRVLHLYTDIGSILGFVILAWMSAPWLVDLEETLRENRLSSVHRLCSEHEKCFVVGNIILKQEVLGRMAATRGGRLVLLRSWSSSCTGIHQVVLTAVILGAAFITCCNADSSCTSNTVEALQEFRSAFSDPSGTVFSSWDNGGDCCAWKGVTCQDGALVVLDVEGPSTTGSDQVTSNQSYSGKPGHTLAKLKDLQTLKLRNLQFSSKIPSQWGSFSDNMVVIIVNNCDLQDDIPSGIASNSHLQTLDLNSNSLTGDIPSKLCNLNDLKSLDLSYNQLDISDIPDCIANGGSITNVNYGHQSSSGGNGGSGSGGSGGSGSSGSGGDGGNGTYSPGYSGAPGGKSTSLLVQSQVMVALLLLIPLLSVA